MTTSHNSPLSLGLPNARAVQRRLIRPTWASHDELIRDYYDHEWGFPVHDEAGVFERLVLEASRPDSPGVRYWTSARPSGRHSKDSSPTVSRFHDRGYRSPRGHTRHYS